MNGVTAEGEDDPDDPEAILPIAGLDVVRHEISTVQDARSAVTQEMMDMVQAGLESLVSSFDTFLRFFSLSVVATAGLTRDDTLSLPAWLLAGSTAAFILASSCSQLLGSAIADCEPDWQPRRPRRAQGQERVRLCRPRPRGWR